MSVVFLELTDLDGKNVSVIPESILVVIDEPRFASAHGSPVIRLILQGGNELYVQFAKEDFMKHMENFYQARIASQLSKMILLTGEAQDDVPDEGAN